MTSPSIGVTVVSGANRNHILEFVRSLKETADPRAYTLHVLATVNEPDQDLASDLRARGAEAKINQDSRGFAENHNAAIRSMPGMTYYLIANDDVVVLRDSLTHLVSYMELPSSSRVAAVSPKLLNIDRTLQASTYGFPTTAKEALRLLGISSLIPRGPRARRIFQLFGQGRGKSRFWDHDETLPVDTMRGAFVLVRADAIADIGLMDEVARVGFEEVEGHKR
ncbi:MAG: hypothetical protein ACREXY_25105, partial [Gammaproteobacteria bacterium]